MDRPLPFVDASASLDEAFGLLSGGSSAVIATRGERPVGVVTKLDVLEYLAPPPRRARPMTVPPIPTARFELVSMSMAFMERLVAPRPRRRPRPRSAPSSRTTCPTRLDHFLQFRIADLSIDPERAAVARPGDRP